MQISANVLQNSVKSHLYIDPTQHSEFQDPSSSNSLDIVLTRFSFCYNSKVYKGTQLYQCFTEFSKRLIRSSKH